MRFRLPLLKPNNVLSKQGVLQCQRRQYASQRGTISNGDEQYRTFWPKAATSVVLLRERLPTIPNEAKVAQVANSWQNGSYEVLLIKRAKDPLKDHWSLPGGHVECGEQSWRTAKRELFEETQWSEELLNMADFSFSRPFDVVDAISFDGSARMQDRSDSGIDNARGQLLWHFLIVEVCAIVRCKKDFTSQEQVKRFYELLDQVKPADDASDARWAPVDKELRDFNGAKIIDEVPDVVYRASMLHNKGVLEWAHNNNQ